MSEVRVYLDARGWVIGIGPEGRSAATLPAESVKSVGFDFALLPENPLDCKMVDGTLVRLSKAEKLERDNFSLDQCKLDLLARETKKFRTDRTGIYERKYREAKEFESSGKVGEFLQLDIDERGKRNGREAAKAIMAKYEEAKKKELRLERKYVRLKKVVEAIQSFEDLAEYLEDVDL